jgi:hypothetical protein
MGIRYFLARHSLSDRLDGHHRCARRSVAEMNLTLIHKRGCMQGIHSGNWTAC